MQKLTGWPQLFARFLRDPAFEERRQFLKSLTLFQDLRFAELGHVAQCMHSRVYHEGETLFIQGDVGRALFILKSGKVELTQMGTDGRPRRMSVIGPGEFFGEMSILEQLPRSATATAAEKSEVLLLYRTQIDSILHYHPRIGVNVMMRLAQLLSARLRRANMALLDRPAP